MKLYIPVSIEQISLERFVTFYTSMDDVERVMVAINKSREYCEGLPAATMQTVIDLFGTACNTGKENHGSIIEINGVKLGFHPNINGLTFKEWADLDQLAKSVWPTGKEPDYTNLPQLMAILFRPVTEQVGTFYNLEPYDSERVPKYIDAVKCLTMDRIQGALLFFSSLSAELVNNSLDYLDRLIVTEVTTITRPQD
jgi:hypothetical protein